METPWGVEPKMREQYNWCRMSGDEAEGGLTLDGIYKDHRRRVLIYLTRLVGEAEAEDLTQEVFVKVGKGLKDFRGESHLLTWIYRIATNTALDRLRSPAFNQKGEDDALDPVG